MRQKQRCFLFWPHKKRCCKKTEREDKLFCQSTWVIVKDNKLRTAQSVQRIPALYVYITCNSSCGLWLFRGASIAISTFNVAMSMDIPMATDALRCTCSSVDFPAATDTSRCTCSLMDWSPAHNLFDSSSPRSSSVSSSAAVDQQQRPGHHQPRCVAVAVSSVPRHRRIR